MHTAFTADSSVKAGHPRPAISVAVSARSADIRHKIEAHARRAGIRIASDGETCDVLFLSVDSSTSSHLICEAAHSAKVCAVWTAGEPSRNTILQMLRSGIAGILSLESTPEQFKAALDAIRANLQVMDPHYSQAEAAPQSEVFTVSEELTDREQQVLAMMADGLANKEISSRLNISPHTVKFHISSILGKLGASSRTEAVSIGVRTGRVMI